MNYREMNLKLLTGELEYIGGMSELSRTLKTVIEETKAIRSALDCAYESTLADMYFENIHALLSYGRRAAQGETT